MLRKLRESSVLKALLLPTVREHMDHNVKENTRRDLEDRFKNESSESMAQLESDLGL